MRRTPWASRLSPHVNVVEPQNLDLLMHVPLQISAELGTRAMTIAEVLQLGTGSIVELDRDAAAPIDVLANGRLVARGEVVAVEEHFGIRITEIVE